MVIVGFTGTQKGATEAQLAGLGELLADATEAHHGDCIGADAQFHDLCIELGKPVVIHPPDVETKRAHCEGYADILPAKAYKARNHDIVDASDVLFATPDGFKEKQRSGTWATVRYARKQGKRVVVVLPDGSVG